MIVKMTFEIAGEVASYLANGHSSEFSGLVNRLHIAEELPLFANAAIQLYVPAPDPESKLIELFYVCFDLKYVTPEELRTHSLHPAEYPDLNDWQPAPTK